MTHYSSTGGGCPQLGGFEAAVLLLVFDSVEALDPVEVGLGLSSGGRLLWTRSQNVITSDRQDRWRAFSIESKLRFCSWVFFWVRSWWDFVIHGLIQDAAHAVKGETPSHPKQIITTCKFDSKSSHINLIYLLFSFWMTGARPLVREERKALQKLSRWLFRTLRNIVDQWIENFMADRSRKKCRDLNPSESGSFFLLKMVSCQKCHLVWNLLLPFSKGHFSGLLGLANTKTASRQNDAPSNPDLLRQEIESWFCWLITTRQKLGLSQTY